MNSRDRTSELLILPMHVKLLRTLRARTRKAGLVTGCRLCRRKTATLQHSSDSRTLMLRHDQVRIAPRPQHWIWVQRTARAVPLKSTGSTPAAASDDSASSRPCGGPTPMLRPPRGIAQPFKERRWRRIGESHCQQRCDPCRSTADSSSSLSATLRLPAANPAGRETVEATRLRCLRKCRSCSVDGHRIAVL